MIKNDSMFTCPILQSHLEAFQEQTLQLAQLPEIHDHVDPKAFSNAKEIVLSIPKGDIAQKLKGIRVYDDVFDKLATKYNFPKNHMQECLNFLNVAAYVYIVGNTKTVLRSTLRGLEVMINELDQPISKLEFRLKPLHDLGQSIDFLFDDTPVFGMLCDTQKNLNELKKLKERLRQTFLAGEVQLGQTSPLGNPGVAPFLRQLLSIWGGFLERSLIQKYDGVNGRKQFLEFAEDCMKPLHPALPYETIDNALKKLVRDVRQEARK